MELTVENAAAMSEASAGSLGRLSVLALMFPISLAVRPVTAETVVIVPAVMFTVLASVAFGNVTVPLADATSLSMFLTLTSRMPAVAGVETAVPRIFPKSTRPLASIDISEKLVGKAVVKSVGFEIDHPDVSPKS